MKQILYNGEVIAKLISQDNWIQGLGFYSNQKQFLQVGTWNYGQGKVLQAHIHNVVQRVIDRTNQVLFIKSGSVQATIFTLEGQKVETLTVKVGDVLILLNCGHGYQILQDNTQVLQIKNGPYFGAQADRRRFEF